MGNTNGTANGGSGSLDGRIMWNAAEASGAAPGKRDGHLMVAHGQSL